MVSPDFERAHKDPAAAFERPAAVLERDDLSVTEKRRLLERWRHLARSSSLTGDAGLVSDVEAVLHQLHGADEEQPDHGVIAVFHDRGQLEQAIDALQGASIDRANINLLTTTPAQAGNEAGSGESSKPVDRAEEGNMQGLMTGMPTYLGAVLAAGATVASGGLLAGVALAALGGAVGGGLAGSSAARMFKDDIDDTYDQELASGGIFVLVVPRDRHETQVIRDTLHEHGGQHIREQRLAG